jgi:hypothetical protein
MATTCEADPFRIRLASSRIAPSLTPCMPFSMPQWPETQARNVRPLDDEKPPTAGGVCGNS